MKDQTLVSLAKIDFSKTNPRKAIDPIALNELSLSISELGVLQPVLLRECTGGRYELVAGERRVRAADKAGLKEIPATVKKLTDEEVLEMQIVENIQRADLTVYEEAQAYGQLEITGLKIPVIAGKVSKKPEYITQVLQLLKLEPGLLVTMKKLNIPLPHALLIARIGDHELQKSAWKNVYQNGNLSSYEWTKNYIARHCLLKLAEAPFDTKDEKIFPEMGACTTCQYRTGANANLFSDVKEKDICTKPSCFEEKVNRWWIEKAKNLKDGERMATAEEMKKMFSYESSTSVDTDSGFRDLNDPHYSAPKKKGKYQTFKALVGNDVDTIIARNPRNKDSFQVYRVAKTSDINKALVTKYAWAKEGNGKVRDGSRSNNTYQASQRASQKKFKENKEKYLNAGKQLLEKVVKEGGKNSTKWIRRIINSEVGSISTDKLQHILKRRGIKNEYETRHKEIKKIASALKDSELLPFLVELFICHDLMGFSFYSSSGTNNFSTAKEILAEYKITPTVPEKVKKEKEIKKAKKK